MIISQYKVALSDERMKVKASSLSVKSLTSSDSVCILGNCTIHGAASCDSLRGGKIGSPVVLSSHLMDFQTTDRFVFLSPVFGKVITAHFIPKISDTGAEVVIGFYNSEGERATSEFDPSGTAADAEQTITFDTRDAQDMLTCSVGVGSSFVANVDTVNVAVLTGVICIEIQPRIAGGTYE